MTSILITGISGFVGGHFTQYLLKKNEYNIHGISRTKPKIDCVQNEKTKLSSVKFHQCDLLDSKRTSEIIKDIQPDYILHLASFSSVAQSWKEPTNAFLNIVEAVRSQELKTKILSVGSSEEYGVVDTNDLPLTEDAKLNPANPYAVARVSEEHLAQIYAKGYHLNICCTRSFNHIGPEQSDQFVVSSIAKQFAEIAVNHEKPLIKIGEGSIVRDFVDVQDVVLAYDLILEKGTPGEVYNVCSGRGYSIRDIVEFLSEITKMPVKIKQNSSLLRPIDNPILIGSNQKLQAETGWKPTCSIEHSLQKIYNYWYTKLS